jgi:murein DD-endopeptidase MepM/ murein hydrolase activator NlpD
MRNIATTRILYASESAAPVGPAKPWIWPLPRLDSVNPSILSPGPTRTDGIIQIGYPDRSSSPEFVPVFAAQDGIITYAVRTEQSTTLCLDHPAGWSTQYGELEHVLALSTDRFRRRRKVRVRAGDVLGHVRSSLRIRFGLSRLVDGEWAAINPAALIHTWIIQPWFAEPISRAGSAIAV